MDPVEEMLLTEEGGENYELTMGFYPVQIFGDFDKSRFSGTFMVKSQLQCSKGI